MQDFGFVQGTGSSGVLAYNTGTYASPYGVSGSDTLLAAGDGYDYGGISSRWNSTSPGRRDGMVAGAAFGGALALGCDVLTSGACVGANSTIVYGSMALGAAIGAAATSNAGADTGKYSPIFSSSGYRKNALADLGIDLKSLESKGLEVHHVVAQNDLAAQPARVALLAVGMNVNELQNLLVLSAGVHRELHTPDYYQAVNAATSLAAASGGGRNAMINTLNLIKTSILIKGSYP